MSLLLPPTLDRPAATPVPVFDIARHGEARALTDGTRDLTYAELSRRTHRFATDHLSPHTRQLVLLEMTNTIDSVVAYLATLNSGHVALLVPPGNHDQTAGLIDAYHPDVVVGRSVVRRRTASSHDLHPDLALLLSTSGSTGSPKLVRLSRDNLVTNARSIADYLALRVDDTAITSLPLHYCYGLSVLHSHLVTGAKVVLSDLSVVDECFWRLMDTERVSTLSAVPYTVELLNSSGFGDRATPHLRRITQAGGRLAPEVVRELARKGQAQGFDLFVMYGQTEATARMTYLPPDLAETHSDAVGRAIPGGELRIDGGEVVYSGPNVMLGYAETTTDLALGRTVTELRTGDLGEIRDGLLHITGRANRVAKVFGSRIDLGQVEAALSRPAFLLAGHDRLTVVGTHETMPCLAAEVATTCHLPTSAVAWQRVEEIPLTSAGKPDLTAMAALSAVGVEAARPNSVAGHFATVLGVPTPRNSDTFAGLGGDSLSYVELATRLETCLPGGVPPDWHTRTIGELSQTRTTRPGTRQDTSITLRALAILLIIGSHVELFDLMGGAHVLLAVAGFNFARFCLAGDRGSVLRRGLASLSTIVVPTSLWILGAAAVNGTYDVRTAFYLNTWFGGPGWSPDWQFWFMDALIWSTLAALTLASWRPASALERRTPFGFALAVLAVTAAVRFLSIGVEADPMQRYQVHVVAMFFALGWLAAQARASSQKLVVTAASLLLVPGFFGQPDREALIVVGLNLLLWLPTVPLPRLLARASGHVATYSLCIYVTHWLVYPHLEVDHPVMAVAASVAVGTAYGLLMRPVQRRVSRLIRRADETRTPSTVVAQ